MWKQHLRMLYNVGTKDESGLDTVTSKMKERYPGNYIAVECFNPILGTWDARLIFNTDADETFFLLQNS
jgi:hypothetical protein